MPPFLLAAVAVIVSARVAHAARVAVGDAETHYGAEQDSSKADARATGEFQPGGLAVAALAAAGHSNLPATFPGASRNGFAVTPEGTSANDKLMQNMALHPFGSSTALDAWPSGAAVDDMLQPTPSDPRRLFLGMRHDDVDYKPGTIAPIPIYMMFTRHLQAAEYNILNTPNKAINPTLFVLDGCSNFWSEGQDITERNFREKGWKVFAPDTRFEVVKNPQLQKEVADLWAKNQEQGVEFDGEYTHRKLPKRSMIDRLGRLLKGKPPMPYTVVCLKEVPMKK